MNFMGSPGPPTHCFVGFSQAGKVSNAVVTKYPQNGPPAPARPYQRPARSLQHP